MAGNARTRMMDSSFRALLEHRVGSRRADQLITDFADGIFDAAKEIVIALGAEDGHSHDAVLHLEAPVSQGCSWTGKALRLTHALPETVLAALPGRTLGDAVSHPCLPADRRIERVNVQSDGSTVILCEDDLVPAATLISRREPALSTWARRRQEDETLRYGMSAGACRHVAGYPVPGLVCLALAPVATLLVHLVLGGGWTWAAAMATAGIAFTVMGATDAHDTDMSDGDGYHWMRDRIRTAHHDMLDRLARTARARVC